MAAVSGIGTSANAVAALDTVIAIASKEILTTHSHPAVWSLNRQLFIYGPATTPPAVTR
jgi:hypothetical protein